MKYSTIFKYRNVWLAFAITSVILYHLYADSSNSVLRFFLYFGYFGVDIFLFASGIGCYYSYMRDHDAKAFLARRCRRILPVYLPFIAVWCVVQLAKKKISALEAVGNVFCLQMLLEKEHSFNWYMNAIWLFYLLTPLFALMIRKCRSKYFTLLWLPLLVLVSFPSLGIKFGNGIHLFMTRLPIYFLGMCFAEFGEGDAKMPIPTVCVLVALMVPCVTLVIQTALRHREMLTKYGMYWYPFLLGVPGCCVLLSMLASAAEKTIAGSRAVKVISRIGELSFEIYLLHFSAMQLAEKYSAPGILGKGKGFCIFNLTLALSVCVLNRLAQRIRKHLPRGV